MNLTSVPLTARLPAVVAHKFDTLNHDLTARLREGLIIAFSGGVDSAFLLWAAEQQRLAVVDDKCRLVALTAVSASMARVEREDARAFATTLGVEHVWEDSHEVSKPEYVVNDGNRCYHCKSELFRIGHELTAKYGCRWLAYGYNASDRGDVRPGHRAAIENEVISPLAAAELTKDDIRTIMRAYNLDLSEKPASPCLSSRLMTGVAVTPEKLLHVEELEALMRKRGLNVFRVRLHEQAGASFLRLEVAPNEMPRAFELREELALEGQARGYQWTTLDLAGYRLGGGNQK